jgi:2-keto-4-pentenoate hydratase
MPHKLTEILLNHRASGILIANLPEGTDPQTAEEAYLIQNETVAALGPVGAWKVQPLPETGQPFAAPILASNIIQNGATLRSADFPSLGIEVEIAVTLNRDLPIQPQGYTASDMRSAIGSIHLALELLASRFVDRKKVPQLTGIADLQHSGGVVLGAAMAPKNMPEFGKQAIRLEIDGVEVASTPGNATTENVLASLAWLANHAAARDLPLKTGDIVITGARLGPVGLTGSRVQAHAQGFESVAVIFE